MKTEKIKDAINTDNAQKVVRNLESISAYLKNILQEIGTDNEQDIVTNAETATPSAKHVLQALNKVIVSAYDLRSAMHLRAGIDLAKNLNHNRRISQNEEEAEKEMREKESEFYHKLFLLEKMIIDRDALLSKSDILTLDLSSLNNNEKKIKTKYNVKSYKFHFLSLLESVAVTTIGALLLTGVMGATLPIFGISLLVIGGLTATIVGANAVRRMNDMKKEKSSNEVQADEMYKNIHSGIKRKDLRKKTRH